MPRAEDKQKPAKEGKDAPRPAYEFKDWAAL